MRIRHLGRSWTDIARKVRNVMTLLLLLLLLWEEGSEQGKKRAFAG